MGWGKSDEEKATLARARAVERAAQAEAKARVAHLASPVGRAETAYESGSGFFQLEIDVASLAGPASSFGISSNKIKSGARPDLLGQVEDVGWHLEHVGYVFIETGSTSTNRVLSTGQGTVTRGVVRGIYLFRRREG